MRWLINGKSAVQLDAADRGLHYGDGVFETMALRDGIVRFHERHLRRLAYGCERLRIEPPPQGTLEREIAELTAGTPSGVVKLVVTRGTAGRGYGTRRTSAPTRVLSLHDDRVTPASFYRHGVRLRFCTTQLGRNRALAGVKHLNRLEQVLARLEADDDQADEGLMLDETGRVISGTMTNLFLVRGGSLITPALEDCGVEGIMRGVVLESAVSAGFETRICDVRRDDVEAAQELFVTNALIGIWPVRVCAGHPLEPGTVTRNLMDRLAAQGLRECAV
ncbi:MAG: aminodeoxychorismate lyase [Gammaproteobacteria bacterium]|nr:aminodeoxychorismate lyase [Gammaproteobacteria bacterium]